MIKNHKYYKLQVNGHQITCKINKLPKFNTQYSFMGMVRFESQEYTLQGRMQFFAKLDKIRLF